MVWNLSAAQQAKWLVRATQGKLGRVSQVSVEGDGGADQMNGRLLHALLDNLISARGVTFRDLKVGVVAVMVWSE